MEYVDLKELFVKEFNKVCNFVKENIDFDKIIVKNDQDVLFHIRNILFINVNFNIQNNINYININKLRKELIKEIGYYEYNQLEQSILEIYYKNIVNK